MPDWLIGLGIFLAVFIGMEGVAWALHKYVMRDQFRWKRLVRNARESGHPVNH